LENSQDLSFLKLIIVISIFFSIIAVAVFYLFHTFRKRIEKEQEALRLAEMEFQRAINEASLQAEQNERAQIAMDLHDEVGALVTILKMNIVKAQKRIEQPEVLQKLFVDTIGLIEHTASTMRQISNRISPPILSKLGLIPALEELITTLESTEKIKIQHRFSMDGLRFKPGAETNIYRIIKETLNNILKYGLTEVVELTLGKKKDIIELVIRYKGVGLCNAQVEKLLRSNNGTGLKSIQSRISNLHATIDYIQAKKGISEIHAKIPYNGIKN
jgi:signal transduction histidine kinase